MHKIKHFKSTALIMTMLRIFVGWHFLYEGISKLANPGWSSSAYLMASKWLFASFFHWIVANPNVLRFVDFLNEWGLICIGLGLFLGLFTRVASISGAGLLLMYYFANPPFINSGIPTEGHYFIVTKDVVEFAVLIFFATIRTDYLWSIDRLIKVFLKKKKEKIFPNEENQILENSDLNTRRELIKNLAAVPLLGAVFFGIAKRHGWMSFEEKNLAKVDGKSGATVIPFKPGQDIKELKTKVPKGKIKDVEISRIIMGGGILTGFAHSRDLIYVSSLMGNYLTDEKRIETLWLCESCGINTLIMRTDDLTVNLLNKYWKQGGKIQWIAQTYPKVNDIYSNIQRAFDNGAIGAFPHGESADRLVLENNLGVLEKAISYIKSKGLICGSAAHSIQTPMTLVKEGIEVDFLMKTFHDDTYWSASPRHSRREFAELESNSSRKDEYHDNFWCKDWQEVADFFQKTPIPWIAYKTLAAGAINPKNGFKHTFENGADFSCVGMFDFQIVENANTLCDIIDNGLNRKREWYG